MLENCCELQKQGNAAAVWSDACSFVFQLDKMNQSCGELRHRSENESDIFGAPLSERGMIVNAGVLDSAGDEIKIETAPENQIVPRGMSGAEGRA